MPSLDNTADELIQRVRDIVDEDNTTDISDALILRMLNRAQQELVRILTKRYKNHYMREVVYSTSDMTTDASSATRVLEVPNQAYGFAVNYIDAKIGSSWFPVQQVPFPYTLGLDNNQSSGLPLSYALKGNYVYLFPAPHSGTEVRIRYQFRAPKIVASQGRITAFDLSTETMTLDSLGSDLTTSVTNLWAFLNIIDHLTGEIKGTVQISGITTTTKVLQVKTSSLDRSSVFGYTVRSDLPADISKDDLVCTADGTAIPLLAHDMTNFLVDIAGFYTKRKLGTVDQADFADRDAIIKAIESTQFGRQYTKKIHQTDSSDLFSWHPFFMGS